MKRSKALSLIPLPTAFWLTLLLYSVCPLGCAVNPATRERQFMIVSEEQEFRMGQQADREVREEMGLYLELPELRESVKRVGETIGRKSDRPSLIYRVEIVDSPDFNAFALPGGFIYVNRGLLERINSEDELASVLGHEIAHVAARHSAAQISKAQLMNIALLGAVIATEGAIQDYGQLIKLGTALYFNKFSRDAEREADRFGTKYMNLAEYNPSASLAVMKQIQSLQAKEPTAFESWFSTHPPTPERLTNLNSELDQLRAADAPSLGLSVKRNQYLRSLEGLAVGEWNGNELIIGDNYYNKEFLLSLTIPEGWQARINSKRYTALFLNPKKAYVVFFDIEPLRVRKTTEEYCQDFDKRLRQSGLRKAGETAPSQASKHGAISGAYSGYDYERGTISVEALAFVQGENAYCLIGSGKQADFAELKPLVEGLMESLRFISAEEVAELTPPRLRLHTAQQGDTWESLCRHYLEAPSENSKLAEYNGYEVSEFPPPGTLIKIPPSLRF